MESTHSVDASQEGRSRQASTALRAELARLRAENASLFTRVEALERATRQAEAASQLAVGAVHDFRNALTVVLSEVALLEELSTEPTQRIAVEAVSQAAAHAVAIAEGILHSAARERGRAKVQLGGAFLERCKPLLTSTLRRKARLVLHPSPNLWSVRVDGSQLEAALVNLVANARDAIGSGGTVHVGARNVPRGASLPVALPAGDYVAFHVQDDGCGMPPSVLAQARDAFFTTKGPGLGTGLGLSMVQAFATGAGGAVALDSEVGRGTRVEVLLPRVQLPVPLDSSDPRFSVLERIERRVRAAWLAELLSSWRKACPRGGLPSPASIEAELGERKEQTVLVDAKPGSSQQLRVLRMGAALARELQRTGARPLSFARGGAFGSMADAYRRAARSRTPSYEFVRYSLGKDAVQFERLLLPMSIDGETVSHLLGAIALPTSITEQVSQ